MKQSRESVAEEVEDWLRSVVVGLNLCPFAKREFEGGKVRFAVTDSDSEEQLMLALQGEIELLESDSSIETTLLVHPDVLTDFADYNQFLACSDGLLAVMDLEGVFQIASFHPDYQFAETDSDDAENFTNRSPYPLLHILREESLERAIDSHSDVDGIPVRNIELMNDLGADHMKSLLKACGRSSL